MKIFKIGVISDTHFPSLDSEIPIEKIQKHFEGVDLIIHAGDLVALPVLDMLAKIAKVEAVCGNMDFPEVAVTLPKTRVLSLNGLSVGVIHGFGPPFGFPKKLFPSFKEKLDVLIFGHTHEAFNQSVNGVFCFNPGSPTRSSHSSRPTIGLITFSSAADLSAKVIFL